MNIDFNSVNEYAKQYSDDYFDIQNSGNLKLKQDDISENDNKNLNENNSSKLNAFDYGNKQREYEDLFNGEEYDEYLDKNNVKKETKFKLKDDE